jgi:flagellar motor switch protein FliM
MAIDDLLSQDEIDMLLRGGGDSDSSPKTGEADPLKDAHRYHRHQPALPELQ